MHFGGLSAHTPRTPGTLPDDVVRFEDLADDVATIAAMVALDTTKFLVGKLRIVFVETVGDFWRYVPAGALAIDPLTCVASGDGHGQWVRMNIANQRWLQARFWAISEATGNDETGHPGTDRATASATPLKTMAEIQRRQVGQTMSGTLEIFQIGAISPGNTTPLTNIRTSDGNGVPYWCGQKILLFTGTVTSYAAANPGANVGPLLIVNSLGGTWSNSGTGGASLVGCLIESADGVRAAIVQKDMGGKLARLTQPNDSSGIGFSPGTAQVFTATETIKVYALPSLPCYPFGPDTQFPVIEYVDLSCGGLFNQFFPGSSEVTWSRCVFEGSTLGPGGGVVMTSGNHSGDFLTCSFTNGQVQIWGGTYLISWCGVRDGDLSVENGTIAPETPIDIQNGSLGCVNGAIVFAGSSTLGAFDCTTPVLSVADEATPGRSIRFRSNDTSQPIYGTGNTGALVSLSPGTSATLPLASVITAVTSAAHPFLVAGVGVDLADIPYTDLMTMAGINNG